MEEWPPTYEELDELQTRLIKTMSFTAIVEKYSKSVRSIGGKDFTHCAICPNMAHKQGSERTPSFYFSENSGRFFCQGCHWGGRTFDFLARMIGCPAHKLILEYAKSGNISLADIPEKPQEFPILDLSFQLSIRLRDYLVELEGYPQYQEELVWVDGIYTRIDERFAKLTDRDYEAARGFYMQILLELERKCGNVPHIANRHQ